MGVAEFPGRIRGKTMGPTGRNTGRHSRPYGIVLLALGLLAECPLPARAAAPEPFIFGTDAEETTLTGKWYGRIYGEAFRRMGIPLTIVAVPTARGTVLADQGEIHGQCSRVFAYADTHPNQLRVEESVHDVRLALHAFGPATRPDFPKRLEDLAAGKWRVEYRRGVAICEQKLKPLVPAERLSDVTSIEQGLKKLKAGRTDLYCDFDLAVRNGLATPELKGVGGYRQALYLDVGLPLYPYLHKSHAELAPRLAETLRKMKAEGLIERYQHEAERELGVTHE